jgi:membrane fusion protein, copper/silver efflux system
MSFGLCALAGAALALACSGGHDGAAPAAAQSKFVPLPADATSAPAKLFVAYVELQRALASDDAARAKRNYAQLQQLAGDAAAVGEPALRTRIVAAAKLGSDAKDIASARKAFDMLSRAMLELLRAVPNPTSVSLRVAHCPMAFDDTGADWLQVGDSVTNPYFGAEMFACGSVGADVKPGQKLVAK